MKTKTDRLVKIEQHELPNLRKLYEGNGYKTYITYCTIDNYIRWFQQDPNIKNIAFYSLNGDCSGGTFVVTDRYQAYVDTLNESDENVIRLIQLLDYSKGYNFISIRTGLRSAILEVVKMKKLKLAGNDTTLLYYLPKEEALKLDVHVPENFKLRSLSDSDAETISSVWPHRHSGSIRFFQNLAKYNSNIGAYTDNDKLVSWLLRLQSGLLCALQTDKNYYGQGLGRLVTKVVAKQIAELGQDIYAGIFEENHPSRELFSKLGFKVVGEVHWITTAYKWTDADE